MQNISLGHRSVAEVERASAGFQRRIKGIVLVLRIASSLGETLRSTSGRSS